VLAIVAEVVIRWAGTAVRSSSWLAVGSRVVWGSVVGSRVVRASKFAVAWASKGAVRSSIELTVSVVSGLSVVDDFLGVMIDWLGVMGDWELAEGVMGSWELTEGVVSSWLVVVDDFLDVMVDWLAIRSSLVWGSVVGTSQWLAIRSTVVGTGQWLGNSATVGNSSMRSLGDSIARLGVSSLLVTVSVGCLGTETTESIVALAVAGAELATVAVAEVAVCS